MAFLSSLLCFYDLLLKQDGASKEDIEQLSKFKFRKVGNEKVAGDTQGGGVMTECGTDSPIEHVLSQDDAVSGPFFWITNLLHFLSCVSKRDVVYMTCYVLGFLLYSYNKSQLISGLTKSFWTAQKILVTSK